MESFNDVMREFYDGEVGGEAIYSALLSSARSDDERFKFSTLLQLETETKAWLRAPMVARGLNIEESAAVREKDAAQMESFKPLAWMQKMQGMRDFLAGAVVPRYQGHLNAARKRGNADEIAICLHMVEHEEAQLEFSRRELAGASSKESLEPVVKHLRYPILR
ncbi:MAG TPA: hypothetical protein VMA09_18895 [Candidatus Binataceae bacterium]|nr:hypothetical protein [Candidatus Binataceae bacterium]